MLSEGKSGVSDVCHPSRDMGNLRYLVGASMFQTPIDLHYETFRESLTSMAINTRRKMLFVSRIRDP